MIQSQKLDVELWNLVGGNQYHTHQIMRIKYKQMLEEKRREYLEWLNRKSKLATEDLT